MIDLIAVGKKISQNRLKHHLSQDQLAEKLSVTRQAISHWEKGIALPTIDQTLHEIVLDYTNGNEKYDIDELLPFLSQQDIRLVFQYNLKKEK